MVERRERAASSVFPEGEGRVSDSEHRRTELRADVAMMRELGVARWGDIVLGPPAGVVARELTPEELRERIDAQRQAQQDVLFAASGIRPRVGVRRGGG